MQGSPRIDELRQKFHENPRRYFAPLANEYRKAGDPEQAIAICRAHLAQQPGHMSGHVVYGQALYDAHRFAEARVVFEKALSLDPDNAIVLRQLGDIARGKGETAEARHWYSRALETDPQDTVVAAYIAELTEPLTEDVGQVAEIEPEPAQAAEIEPEPAPVAATFAMEPDVAPESGMGAVAVPELETATAASEPGEVPWRKTPAGEDSPFVTRTMAELYALQGYRNAALDVYRQLAIRHPDDTDIRDRINELSVDQPVPAESSPAEPPTVESPSVESPFVESPSVESPFVEPATVESSVAEAAMVESPPEEVSSVDNDDLKAAEPEDAREQPGANEPHFTEMELSVGDAWDTDAWGSGFSPDDISDLSFDTPDVAAQPPASAAVEGLVVNPEKDLPSATAEELVQRPGQEIVPEPGQEQVQEPVAEQVPLAAEVSATEPEAVPMPLPVAEIEPEAPESFAPPAPQIASEPIESEKPAESFDQIEPSEAMEAAPPAETAEPEPADETPDDESHLVAYSPQPPEGDELPHFAPKGPTVREFFATLGARRPPATDPRAAFTARTVVPSAIEDEIAAGEPEHASVDDLPLAQDAFASLFPGEDVSEEDTRAAFALSGALGVAPPPESVTQLDTPPATPAVAASPAGNTQESEEDIRRFREWLDGLAES